MAPREGNQRDHLRRDGLCRLLPRRQGFKILAFEFCVLILQRSGLLPRRLWGSLDDGARRSLDADRPGKTIPRLLGAISIKKARRTYVRRAKAQGLQLVQTHTGVVSGERGLLVREERPARHLPQGGKDQRLDQQEHQRVRGKHTKAGHVIRTMGMVANKSPPSSLSSLLFLKWSVKRDKV